MHREQWEGEAHSTGRCTNGFPGFRGSLSLTAGDAYAPSHAVNLTGNVAASCEASRTWTGEHGPEQFLPAALAGQGHFFSWFSQLFRWLTQTENQVHGKSEQWWL